MTNFDCFIYLFIIYLFIYLFYISFYCAWLFALYMYICAEGGLEDAQARVQARGCGGVIGGRGLGAEINAGPPFVFSSLFLLGFISTVRSCI